MIIKKRKKPLNLERYEVLRARLSENSPNYRMHMKEAYKYERGYEGELLVDEHLNFLASEFTVLQDITLRLNGQPFQMDTLLISPQALYLIEVKNFKDTIVFDTVLEQFIRENNQRETGFNHPLTQLKLQKMKLETWLEQHEFPNIPIHPLLVINETETIIKVHGDAHPITEMVTHGERLPLKIMEINKQKETDERFAHLKIGKEIVKRTETYHQNIFADVKWQPGEIKPGVRCSQCFSIEMKKVGRKWCCPACHFEDIYVTKHSINDYFMLFKPWMTNKICKQFLQLGSRHQTLTELKKAPHIVYDRRRRVWRKKVNK